MYYHHRRRRFRLLREALSGEGGWGLYVGIGGLLVGKGVGRDVGMRCQRFARGRSGDVGLEMPHPPMFRRVEMDVAYIDLYLMAQAVCGGRAAACWRI